jgi:DNA excision repair protein ERCC-3
MAVFYSVVTRRSCEEEFAEKRQLFLTEQGYEYAIEEAGGSPAAARARGSRRGTA